MPDCLGWATGQPCGTSCWVCRLVAVFRELRRVLRPDGTCWLNVGDSYSTSAFTRQGNLRNVPQPPNDWAGTSLGERGRSHHVSVHHREMPGLKPKDLCMLPARLALALQADGWWLRSEVIWHKLNPMPESVHGSYFTRHRVTIKEYERLQTVRRAYRHDHTGSRHVPNVYQSQGETSQAQIPREREGSADHAPLRTTPAGQGTETPGIPGASRSSQQSQIRANGQRSGDPQESPHQILDFSPRQSAATTQRPETQAHSALQADIECHKQTVSEHREGQSDESPVTGQAFSPERSDTGTSHPHRRTMVGNAEESALPLLLLQEEAPAHDGSCDSPEQRGPAHAGKRRASLPGVQFEQEGSDPDTLIDCPGCPKCEAHNGYILINGAGRPTKAHEQVYLLTKSPKYHYDAEAVKEHVGEPTRRNAEFRGVSVYKDHIADKISNHAPRPEGQSIAGAPSFAGRNLRSVWSLASEPTPFAHFATFPSALVRRCLLASCSAGGVCAGCGAPYKRQVERQFYGDARTSDRALDAMQGKTRWRKATDQDWYTPPRTTGFAPACACGPAAGVTSAVCLDPFAGAGTTMLTARDLFIRSIGVELNPTYCDLAASRLTQGVLALAPGVW